MLVAGLALTALGPQAPAPLRPSAAPPDRAGISIACRLADRFRVDMRLSRPPAPPNDWTTLTARLAGLSWRALPAQVHCSNVVMTLRPVGFGRFVTDVAEDGTGRFVGLRGGWQVGDLEGGGADCLYERTVSGIVLVGCRHTWVS